MAIISSQIDEIKSLIYSNSKSNKSLAYSTLLHLQHHSSNHLSSLQALADVSISLFSTMAVDISDDDEEIAAQALKCLGFMIYHPSLVSTITCIDDAGVILMALAKVIVTTKIKSVCNLGVWCISMQRFDASVVAAHFDSVLQSVVYGLDNPIGSLSTTFEAIQAVTKLVIQLSEKMRGSSHIWAPPIYRRLLSDDKRERDMSERCLLKIRSAIVPPSAALSKAIAEDIKRKLLTRLEEFLNKGMKVQTMQAWGWFIRMLGSHATRNRLLINDMLKIPEQTFSDQNPQVQIASLVAWEGLVDALIQPPMSTLETSESIENGIQKEQATDGNSWQECRFSKSIKLIMTPLVGVIVSRCDASVQSSCLNTWCYLLHKLDILVNHSSMVELVINPIFEAVFQAGPCSRTIWSWDFCLGLLNDFILEKCRTVENESTGQLSDHLLNGTSGLEKRSRLKHPIKWLLWGVSQMDFFVQMIKIIISHASSATVAPENKNSVCDSALMIFNSLLKGVQKELKSLSLNYNDVMSCLTTILGFMKNICEDARSEGSGTGNNELHHQCLDLIEAVIKELDPSILGSPLYKVALDLKYIEYLQSATDMRYEKFTSASAVGYMDMVSPFVYLMVLYICEVLQSTSNPNTSEFIQQRLQNFLKFVLCSYDPLEYLCVTIGLFYKHMEYRNLHIWVVIVKGLKDFTDGLKDLPVLQLETVCSDGYLPICHLLSYPFAVFALPNKKMMAENSNGSSKKYHEFDRVIEVWMSLYCDLCASRLLLPETNKFSEDLCSMLNGCIDSVLDCATDPDLNIKASGLDILSLCGNAVICILEQILMSSSPSDGNKSEHAGDSRIFGLINNILECTARYLKLSRAEIGGDPVIDHLTSRVFSALSRFVSCLHLKQHILLFSEIITCPLLQWLSLGEIQNRSTAEQLQHLWEEILSCLKRSQPPIVFDSSFLELQAQLLEKTLDHPEPTISELTISFWNSTYGEQIKLNYPASLLGILDKLSRSKRIILHKKSLPFLVKCHSAPEMAAPSYKVTSTSNRTSKRVELVEYTVNQVNQKGNLYPSSKRKRPELTEHQKEVRRAQQGRGMDCSGHGPGVRTYTSVDFSQGNEDSQESQDIQDPDTILKMLSRVA